MSNGRLGINMGKIYKTKINRFDGGISDSPYAQIPNQCTVTRHFNIYRDRHRLLPNNSWGDNSTGQEEVSNFLFSSESHLLGLGKVSGQNWPQIYRKTIGTNWNQVAPTNFTGTTGTVDYDLFCEYNGYIFFGVTSNFGRVKADDSEAIKENEVGGSLTYIKVRQGLIHPSTNVLYIPNYRNIATVNSSFTNSGDAAPPIGEEYEIMALAEYGNYLAIGCRATRGNLTSKVFIWDMVSTTSWVDIIDFGDDELQILNNLGGHLIGISQQSSFKATVFTKKNYSKATIRKWSGNTNRATVIKEIRPDENVSSIVEFEAVNRINFIHDDRMYFGINYENSPYTQTGIFCIDKNDAVSCDIVFAAQGTGDVLAAIVVADVFWINYNAAGTIIKQNLNYEDTSIYETQKFSTKGLSTSKKLLGVSVQTNRFPYDSNKGSVVLKYRKDEDDTWTTIFTNTPTDVTSIVAGKKYTICNPGTTDFTLIGAADSNSGTVFIATGVGIGTGNCIEDLMSHEAINIEATAVALPEYKTIQFRLESLNGSEITGLSFTEEVINKNKYG